jgi:hypothetical protein
LKTSLIGHLPMTLLDGYLNATQHRSALPSLAVRLQITCMTMFYLAHRVVTRRDKKQVETGYPQSKRTIGSGARFGINLRLSTDWEGPGKRLMNF